MPESVTDRCTKSHEYVFLLTKSPRYFYDADAIREPHVFGSGGWQSRYKKGKALLSANSTTRESPYLQVGGAMVNDGYTYNPAGRNKRSVWTLGPESYKGAHFAVMPTKLVEPCILAGCPHKVCAECGAPWVRQVEREYVNGRKSGPGNRAALGDVSATSIFRTNLQPTSTTTGFAPTCDCGGDTRPGVVLDPFLGSGTVAVVARRLGRDWLGFELNPEYVELAYKRIDGTQPPLFVEGL